MPPTLDLSKVDAGIQATKRRIQNMMAYQRGRDPRWNSVQLTGWWEIDRDSYGDLEQFGRNKRIAMRGLGWPLFARCNESTVWRPHLHGIVALSDVTGQEFADALRTRGHGAPYQVSLKPFDRDQSVVRNIKGAIRYALKFRIERGFKGVSQENADATRGLGFVRSWWDQEDIREYVEWLMCKRGGFERLRFVVRAV